MSVAGSGRIDLNSDVGESYGIWRMGDDEAVLEVVTSANVACGYHAGDPATIEATVRAAQRRGVAVGAHPSYPDLEGFGRRSMRLAYGDVEAMVLYQVGALDAIARANGTRLTHVKPHGALYNDASDDRQLADAIVSAVRRAGNFRLVGLAGSALIDAARSAGLPSAGEAFCDRRYGDPSTSRNPRASAVRGQEKLAHAFPRLVSRTAADAVISEPDAAARQALDIALRGRVRTVDGGEVELQADTLCVHGDTPGAAQIARAVRDALEGAGVRVAALE